jgi:hypothetical protein
MAAQKLTEKNYMEACLRFRDRQAGVGVVYCPDEKRYYYNAYCLETKLVKELMSVEYEFLDDALEFIDDEFGTWEIEKFEESESSGCSTCVAK